MTNTEIDSRVPYKASDMHESVDKEILRLKRQVLWSWAKESRNLVWFGLRDGMSILELGSGPGFVTEQLLALCPNSHVTGVEVDPDLAAPADRYLGSIGLSGSYRIVQGDIMSRDLPANTFDFAFARFVFQHRRDPEGAMKEILRVLKPGGKLVIHDIDVGLGEIMEPSNPEAEAIEARMHEARAERGGDPRIGRRLSKLFEGAGYVDMDLEAAPAHTSKLGFETLFPDEWEPGAFKPALQIGAITEADVETLHRADLATYASPDRYALFVSLMVYGQRPA